MRRSIPIIALALAALAPASGLAETAKLPTVQVSDAWLRATPKNAPVAGGYATIVNKSDRPDTLLGASLPMASKGEVHSMSMKNGIMHMKRLDKGIEIPAGATLTLAPGANHLMFIRPTVQVKEGERIKGTLNFTNAGPVTVTFAVAGMAAKAAPGDVKAAPGGKPGTMDEMKDMPAMGH